MKVYAVHYKFVAEGGKGLVSTSIGVFHDLEDAIANARENASNNDEYVNYSFKVIQSASICILDIMDEVKELAPEEEAEKKVIETIKQSNNFDHLIQQL